MKYLEKISGDKNMVIEMAMVFAEKYKNRPTMREELQKAGYLG